MSLEKWCGKICLMQGYYKPSLFVKKKRNKRNAVSAKYSKMRYFFCLYYKLQLNINTGDEPFATCKSFKLQNENDTMAQDFKIVITY